MEYNVVPVSTDNPNYIAADWSLVYAKCRPVPLDKTDVAGYLGKRIDRNLASLMLGLQSPIPAGFEAAAVGKEPPPFDVSLSGAKTGLPSHRLAADSDVYKWLEGACYALVTTGDSALKKEIDRIVGLIIKCQEDDGYINGQVNQKVRWDPRINHDLYIAGHLFEAAAAHYRATDDRSLLDAACRFADYLISEYRDGNEYFKTSAMKEHSEYELGLLRLYRATGEQKYLDFSVTLTKELCKVGPKVEDISAGGELHAVRVGYLLAGMADLYLETGSGEMRNHLEGLWDELVQTRMYVTGAIGSVGEDIAKIPYLLPHTRQGNNDRSLGETCASVAMIMFSWRMHAIDPQSRYFDVIEKILYNHYLGAIALNGKGTFYYNPMAIVGDISDKSDHWHKPASSRCMLPRINRTSCCIGNVWRFLGALPEYLFSYDDRGLFVNLYTSSKVCHTLRDGRKIDLSIETAYPHDGNVKVRVEGEKSTSFALRLRIPAWCESAVAALPGENEKSVETGKYLVIDREWKNGDTIELKFAMPVRVIEFDPKIEANAGQIVIARGPIVYCLEQEDVDFPVDEASVAINAKEVEEQIRVEWLGSLLDGIHMLTAPGRAGGKSVELKLVPWSVRANRSEDSRWIIFLPLDEANY